MSIPGTAGPEVLAAVKSDPATIGGARDRRDRDRGGRAGRRDGRRRRPLLHEAVQSDRAPQRGRGGPRTGGSEHPPSRMPSTSPGPWPGSRLARGAQRKTTRDVRHPDRQARRHVQEAPLPGQVASQAGRQRPRRHAGRRCSKPTWPWRSPTRSSARVRARALSAEVMKSLTPAQQVVKIVRDELQETLGGEYRRFVLPSGRIAVVMMAGVQGSGKTTACAKLALRLKKDGPATAPGRRRPRAARRGRAAVHPRRRGRRPGRVRGPRSGEGREERAEGGGAEGLRRRDRRHRGASARRRGDDEAGAPHPRRREARSRPDGLRRDDGAGRRRSRPARSCNEVETTGFHPDEARRRCARRRRALDHRGDGRARCSSRAWGRSPRTSRSSTPTGWPAGSWGWATC